MRSSIWKKGLICLSAVMLLECPVGALPGTAYTAKAEETDDKTDTSNIKSILLIGQDKREGQSRQRSDSMILATLDKDQKTIRELWYWPCSLRCQDFMWAYIIPPMFWAAP